MKTYLHRETAEKMLEVMNQFPDHEVFLLEVDNSSGIGSTVTLTVDIIYNNVAGKFAVEVEGIQNW
jgi:hypothetical protein